MEHYSLSQVADMLSVSKETLRRWDRTGKLSSIRHPINGYRFYERHQLQQFEQLQFIFDNKPIPTQTSPAHNYQSIELFAGAGGLALGLEKAGLSTVLLNEIDPHACNTLKQNRPHWHVHQGDITELDFSSYRNKVDIITGGFPCQAFSYAGKKMGFEDARGTLFFEFARAIKEVQPRIFMAENVRGLINHDQGRTLDSIRSVIDELGYTLLEPRLMKAIFYRVPQKRERLILIGIRNDMASYASAFRWPHPHHKIYTLKDALKAGALFDTDVPPSNGQRYPEQKKQVMQQVPPGGYWRDLPEDVQKSYMKKSYYLGGGKTGMARRMHWDEPSLTLTCAPAQKQTERCHPDETRPFTIREYARIQTFPDDWHFSGSMTAQYKQIGNAVPVNLAFELGRSLIHFLDLLDGSDSGGVSKTSTRDACQTDKTHDVLL